MSTIIDAKGKPCPTPVILAKQAMAAGEHSFTVLVDNTTAVENLKRLAGNQGFGAAVTQGEGVFSVAFTRTGCAACEEAVSAPLPAPGGDWAVFVGRDIIGDGDRELGANLMRMFFYTLVQGEDKPGAVLFMNAGVRLPTLDEQIPAHEQQEGQAHQKQDDGNENHSGQTDDAQCEQRNHGISPPFDGTSLPHPDKSVLKAFLKSDKKSPASGGGAVPSAPDAGAFFCVPVRPNGFHKSLASRLLSRQNVMDIRWMHRINALGHEEMGRTVM